jgi:hypothetical protein
MNAPISDAAVRQFLTIGFGAFAVFFALCVASLVA